MRENPSPVWLALHRAVLATERGPLRPFWRLAYATLARAYGGWLRGADPRTSLYVRGAPAPAARPRPPGDPGGGLAGAAGALALVPAGLRAAARTPQRRPVREGDRRSGSGVAVAGARRAGDEPSGRPRAGAAPAARGG